ncbi:MAG TPA: thioredoxin domain-containing protein [Allosphingosinicella sp.]|nr:thioredoxin domain-containing protein [Allosphingosinicella sp.]
MKSMLTAGAAALALILTGCGDGGGGGNQTAAADSGALKQIPAPNGDWTQMVVKTPEGGFRMGNPDAPVKLVEYGSLGCHVCAEFEEQGAPALRDTYVKSGQVSWEFRTYILFPTDPGVSMLLQCQTEGAFFPSIEQLYADQSAWMRRIQSLPPEQLQALQTMPPLQAAGVVVRAGELDEFFRQRGMPGSRIQSCLADPAVLEKVVAIKELGNREGVNGTPSFFINGKFAEQAPNWATLEPKLRAAIP